jgi:hypothetical protein
MNQRNTDEDAQARTVIVERLSRASVALSTRDIAQSTRLQVPLVHRCLLNLQRDGIVTCQRRRWRLQSSAGYGKLDPSARVTGGRTASTGSTGRSDPVRGHGMQSRDSSTRPGMASTPESVRQPPAPSIVNSRWATFRRLCQYYAECVRLDQGTTLHGKADQENWKFVCLAGNLAWPESDEPPQMRIQISSGWSEFIKQAKQGTHRCRIDASGT